jgi:hypothetical protein
MANNRKPINKRGKLSRLQYKQIILEAQFVMFEGELIANHKYPGNRTIIHWATPNISPIGWGYEGQKI